MCRSLPTSALVAVNGRHHPQRRVFSITSGRSAFTLLALAPVFVLIFLAAFQSAEAEENRNVTLVSTEIPAYISADGGAYREFFEQAAARAGVELNIRLIPWIRAVKRAERSEDLMIFPLTRNAEREDRFTWLAKLSDVSTGFATLNEKIDTLEQGRALSTVIVWRGSSMESFLQKNGFTNLFGVSDSKTILSLLKQGRAAAWFGVLDEARSVVGTGDELILGAPVNSNTVWLAGGKNHRRENSIDFVRMVDDLRDKDLLRDLIAKYHSDGLGS